MKPLITILEKSEGALRKLKKGLQKRSDRQFTTLERWYGDDPHGLRRSTFPHLTKASVVFDLGGYEGQWTSDVYARYGCEVCVFEPVAEYAGLIRDRFLANSKIHVLDYGLAPADGEVAITINEFASSFVNKDKGGGRKQTIRLRSFSSFVAERGISKIDLVKINIEGAEYELLEDMIAKKLVPLVDTFLIQFHDFVPDAEARVARIEEALSKTHRNAFNYPFVWTCWKQ
jgi:FkbM family methyltransferase